MSKKLLTAIDDALEHILQQVQISTAIVEVELASILGSILGETIKAGINVPGPANAFPLRDRRMIHQMLGEEIRPPLLCFFSPDKRKEAAPLIRRGNTGTGGIQDRRRDIDIKRHRLEDPAAQRFR